jgi:recombination protein RecA
VEKSGAWFSYKGERIGQGRENVKQFLKDNKDMMVKLEAELRKELGLHILVQEPAAPSVEQKQAAAAHAKMPARR